MKKRLLAITVVFAVLLCGCGGVKSELQRAMALRSKLLNSNGFSFDAVVTADYGEKIYTFEMGCQSDQLGNLTFTVLSPETIAGITGKISETGGKLTFDDQALAFELLAEDQLTPVSAPWILVHTLLGGYISSCSSGENGLMLSIDETYEDDALNLSVWLGEEDLPTDAEILCGGRRILSLTIKNFVYL